MEALLHFFGTHDTVIPRCRVYEDARSPPYTGDLQGSRRQIHLVGVSGRYAQVSRACKPHEFVQRHRSHTFFKLL